MGELALIEYQWYWKASSQECFSLVLLKYWKCFHLLNNILSVHISFISESMAIWLFIRDSSLLLQWGNKPAQFSPPLCRGKAQRAAETSANAPCTGSLETLQCTKWHREARQCQVNTLNKGLFFSLRNKMKIHSPCSPQY